MSGVATPPVVYRPFGADQVGPYITVPIPDAPPVTPGLASFSTGFPAANMTNPAAGGVPPSGADMNGILYTVSAWCARLQAGQFAAYNLTVATAISGYAVGAIVYEDAGLYTYTNTLDGNTTDPGSSLANWKRNEPAYVTTAPAAGQIDNAALPGPSDYVWDVDTTAGNVDFSGFIAQRDGQRLYLSNTGANLLQVLALNGGSTSPRQVRAATDLAVIQNQTLTLQYSAGATKWLIV